MIKTITYLKSILLLSLLGALMFSSCCPEDELDPCFFDLKFVYQALEVPVEVIPNNSKYQVGDTILFRSVFSDSIYDLSADEKFLVRDFPFRPISLIFRFFNDFEFESGYEANQPLVDEKYNPRYNPENRYTTDFRGEILYENGIYTFEHRLILENPGIYVMWTTDMYNENIIWGNTDANALADSTMYDGRCKDAQLNIIYDLKGIDYLKEFEDYLVWLDQNIYQNDLATYSEKNREELASLKWGDIKIDFSAAFCFEVVE